MRLLWIARYIVAILLSVSSLSLHAQHIQTRYLGIENGLSNNAVTAIFQDHNGFMWIGTYDGLNHYDGYRFRTFRNVIGDSSSIGSNNINSIDEDAMHYVWVGGQKGVSIYNPGTSIFLHPSYTLYKRGTKQQLNDNVLAVKVIKGSQVLVGMQHHGLFFFTDHRKGRQIPLEVDGKEIVEYYVSAIDYNEVENKAFVFIANYGLYEYDLKAGTLRLRSNVIRNVNCLKVTRSNVLWLGNDQGLFRFDASANSISKSVIQNSRPIVNLCEAKNGDLWVATDGTGVWLLAQGSNNATPLPPNEAGGKSLINSNAIYAIYEDKEQRKWIGTLRGGINVIEPATPFTRIVFQPDDNNSSVKNFIFSFCEDGPGNVWIGTDGAGLRYWNRLNNTYQTFEHNTKIPGSISSNFITSIIKDAENNLWLSTWFGGINRFNKETKSFERFDCYNERTKSNNNHIWRLLADSRKRLWACAVRSGGLYKFDYASKKFKGFDLALSDLQVIAEDSSGNIWAGDYLSLILVDTLYKQHKVYTIGYPVRAIYEDKKHNFWIGTQEGGLLLFNRKNGSFKRYSTSDGLSNNTVLRILEDDEGSLWLSTYNGLSKFNPQRASFENFYQSDGLQSNQFSYNAALKLGSGELLFGGIKGFNVFNPKNIRTRNNFPPLYLSGLRVNNRPVEENEALVKERVFEQVKRIVVPYDQALLTLEYLGIDYSDVSKINYAYRLKGWDKQWNFVNNTRTANYSRLQPGDYTFEVKVSNKKGGWSEAQTLLSITVMPPWYRTWWAYCLYCLVASTLLYLYIRYKNRQTKLKYQVQLANLEMQKEKELNEKKIIFFTNISHEFRTPLSLIINPIKDLLQKRGDGGETSELRIVYRNAKRLLRLVDQLLLFKKAEQNFDQLNLSRQNVLALCRDVFLCFVEQARFRNIRYELKCVDNNLTFHADREKIEIALFNLLSNAFKFTPDAGTILFAVEDLNADFKISISDTGTGIPLADRQRLFERFAQLKSGESKGGFGIGLYLVKNFVEAHNGTVTFESEMGKGTTFHIRLPKEKVEVTPAYPALSSGANNELNDVNKNAEHESQPLVEEQNVPSATGLSVIVEEMNEEAMEKEVVQEDPAISRELVSEMQSLLIIDDDDELRQYLINTFTSHYKIFKANNGEDGVRLAKQHLPDLILSDIMMQGMNGLDLCRTLKVDNALNHIPIILLTGTSADEMQLESMNSGADDYIRKPFDKEILVAKVGAMLKRRNILQSYFYNEVTLGSAKFKVSVEYKEFIERCMKIIEDHLLDDSFSIKVLAAEIGMSHSNLYKKIRAVSGQSVNSFIRFVRLKKAAELFISTELNVNETATMLGFGDMKYFRTQFCNQFGLNPSQYIKKFRKPFHHNQTLNENLIK